MYLTYDFLANNLPISKNCASHPTQYRNIYPKRTASESAKFISNQYQVRKKIHASFAKMKVRQTIISVAVSIQYEATYFDLHAQSLVFKVLLLEEKKKKDTRDAGLENLHLPN